MKKDRFQTPLLKNPRQSSPSLHYRPGPMLPLAAAPMLTRSRARAVNQPIFVDDKWNDEYIHTKDEQIDAIARAAGAGDWSDGSDSDSDDASDSEDADVWRSDDDANADSDDDDSDDSDRATAHTLPTPLVRQSASRFAGGGFAENACWTVLSVLVVPLALYAAAFKRCVYTLYVCGTIQADY